MRPAFEKRQGRNRGPRALWGFGRRGWLNDDRSAREYGDWRAVGAGVRADKIGGLAVGASTIVDQQR